MFRIPLLTLAAATLLTACGSETDTPPAADENLTAEMPSVDGHDSRNSLDWPGRYHGVTPCADCEGIDTTLTITDEGTFSRSLVYLGKAAAPVIDEGAFEWDDSGRNITLAAADGSTQRYQVGENVLFHLDQAGLRIQGELAAMYQLTKTVNDPAIEDRKWLLVELFGAPMILAEGGSEAFIQFDSSEGRATGNSSCNNFFGPYLLKAGNRIRFSPQMGMTMRACPEMESESTFMSVLQQADNYTIADGILALNRARMAPLARFELADE